MSLFENHAGINITGSSIQIVELGYINGSFILENIDEEPFSEIFDITLKETKFLSILQSSFDKIVTRRPLICKSVSVSLPNHFFRVVEIPYDNTLVLGDLIEHFKWELSVLYPQFSSDDFIVQHINFDKSRLRNNKYIIIVALIKKYLKLVYKFCTRNNLNLKLVDNSHIAANTSLLLEHPRLKDEVFVHIMIAQNELSVMLLEKGLPLYFKLKQYSSSIEIIPRLQESFADIQKLGINENLIDKFFITGNVAVDEIIRNAKDKLNLTLLTYNPFAKIKVNPSLQNDAAFINKFNRFSSPAGIAYRLI